jgi:hypothetical protein
MIMHSLAGVTISAQWVHRHTAEHIMQNKYCNLLVLMHSIGLFFKRLCPPPVRGGLSRLFNGHERRFLRGVKRRGVTPPSSTFEVKKEWRCNYLPPYACMACNFAFISECVCLHFQ